MTKVIKWWIQFSFWDKFRMFLGAIGIGGEVTLFIADSYHWWKVVAAVATALSIWLTFFNKDENKNGIVDWFEKIKKSK